MIKLRCKKTLSKLESRGKENIKDKEERIGNLLNEENEHMCSKDEG